MMRYKAVIFDLDGTLLDTLGDLAASTNRALDHFGLPQRSLEEVRQFVGNGVEKLIRRAVPTGTSEDLTQDCLAWFKRDYMVHMQDQTAPYAGILALLRALRDNGCKAAVVSNKFDGAVKELCREHFGDLLPVAIGERPGAQKKPARDLVDLGAADEVIPEPAGGAHENPNAAFVAVDRALSRNLLQVIRKGDYAAQRYEKYRGMGLSRSRKEGP